MHVPAGFPLPNPAHLHASNCPHTHTHTHWRSLPALQAPINEHVTWQRDVCNSPEAMAWLQHNLHRVKQLELKTADNAVLQQVVQQAGLLQRLVISDCTALEQLPEALGNIRQLTGLVFDHWWV